MPRRGHNNRRRVEEEEDDDDDDDEEEEDDEEIENDEDDDEDEDDDDDPLQHLPDYVLARVEKLQGLHAVRESIMDNYLIERAELEKKYESLLQPIYKERSTIVQGIHDDVDESVPNIATTTTPPSIENLAVTDNTVAEEEIIVDATATTAMDGEEEEERLKGVPQFWACTMTRIETIGELVTVDDLGCLDYLIDITCMTHDDGKGFTLTFYFSPDNTYFTNPTLTKTYIVPNILISDEPIIKEVKGCTIFWKTGMSLTHKTVKKKQRGKGRNAGQVRSVTKQEEKESFFHWFTTPEMPTSVDDMDEEEAEHLEEVFENDFEIAQAFRNFIVPNAVQWFTGQVRASSCCYYAGSCRKVPVFV
jgi:nucleosome assembly protein 1-like 1